MPKASSSRRAAALLALAAAGAAAQPAPGRYVGELCVATGAAAPNCGPVLVELQRRGMLQVRIADIVYQLQAEGPRLDVILMHGAMQIDGFSTGYAWAGDALRFADPDKPVAYVLTIAAPR